MLVREAMSAPALSARDDIPVESRLVVDDHARVVGVIRRRDVFRLLARPDRVVDAEVDDLFRRLSLVWLVDVRDGVVTPTGRRDRTRAAPAAALASSIRGWVSPVMSLVMARD